MKPPLPRDYEQWQAQQQGFAKAMAAFQGDMNGAKRDGKNPHFRTTYATLSSVLEAIKPATKHGLSHTQTCERIGEQIILVTTLRHDGGYEVRSELPLVLGNDWQKFGSAFTYARRYALMAIYGIASADDDDDGERAVGAAPQAPGPKAEAKRRAASKPQAAPASPLADRIEAVKAAMNALHEADPNAIQPLVAAFKEHFQLPATATVANNLDNAEHLSWLEQQLGLPLPPSTDD